MPRAVIFFSMAVFFRKIIEKKCRETGSYNNFPYPKTGIFHSIQNWYMVVLADTEDR